MIRSRLLAKHAVMTNELRFGEDILNPPQTFLFETAHIIILLMNEHYIMVYADAMS